jgi:hypothetical protein
MYHLNEQRLQSKQDPAAFAHCHQLLPAAVEWMGQRCQRERAKLSLHPEPKNRYAHHGGDGSVP